MQTRLASVFAMMRWSPSAAAPDAPYDSCSYLKDSWIFVR
jgi:hypothetical protein